MPRLRLIFLSLFISSFLLPMERTIKSTSKKSKENIQEEAFIESCSDEDEAYPQQKKPMAPSSKESSHQQTNKTRRLNVPVTRQSGTSCGYHSMLNAILSLPGINKNAANEINIKFTQENGAWRSCIIKRRKESLVKNYIKKLLHKYMPHNQLNNDEREALNNISKAYADAYLLNENLNILKDNVKNIPAQLENILLKHCPKIRSLCHAEHDKQLTYLDNCRACIQKIDFNRLKTEIAHANTLIETATAYADETNKKPEGDPFKTDLSIDLHGDNLDTAEMENLKAIAFQEYGVTDDCITIIDSPNLLESEMYQGILNPAKQQMLGNNCRHAFCIRTNANTTYNQQEVNQLTKIINSVKATPEEKNRARARQTEINRQLSADTGPTHWFSIILDRKNGQNTYSFKDSMGDDLTNHPNASQLINALEPERKKTKEHTEPKQNAMPQAVQPKPNQNKPAQPDVEPQQVQAEPVHNAQPKPIKDEFKQERDFHLRIQKARPDLFDGDELVDDVQAYYKKITPIISTPDADDTALADKWTVNKVTIGEKKLYEHTNGTYAQGDISLTIDPVVDFDPTNFLDVTVSHGEESDVIQFINNGEKKVPFLPPLKCYNDIANAIRNKQITLMRYITLEGIVETADGGSCVIEIECENQRAQPIKLRGMEFVFTKKDKRSKVFLDFVDSLDQSIDHFNPIECGRHAPVVMNNKVLCIQDHKMYECDTHRFFDSTETRKKWIPDESKLYDQIKNKMMPLLPDFYSDPIDPQKNLKKPIVWVFGDKHNALYQLYGAEELQDTNDYIYSEGGSFFVVLPYKATYKECFSNNVIELDYLVKVPKPHILIHAGVEGGEREWDPGLYKRIKNATSIWENVENPKAQSIDFNVKDVEMRVMFPADPLTIEENKKYCEASQRFFVSFSANIHRCNQEISNKLPQWNKIQWLNLSRLQLENGLTWNNVFTAVGKMTQLKSLHFENNHPIADLMANKTYADMANTSLSYYQSLALCLRRLINLKELHIQGLWLKPHRELGSGCNGWICVSTQVATLTGIINHGEQFGVKAIIRSICALQNLENLSIDGIPNHGSSEFARHTYGERIGFSLIWIVSTPFQVNDANHQDTNLKQLVIASANQLISKPLLKTISVYSPGGNCVDYFSQDFKNRLKQAKKALNVISKDLQ